VKKLSKKKLKRFRRTYQQLLEVMCEEYNRGDLRVSKDDGGDPIKAPWLVGELKPELAWMNHLYIAPPDENTIDVLCLRKENNGRMYELVRMKLKDIIK
jgi:hypothetical protein